MSENDEESNQDGQDALNEQEQREEYEAPFKKLEKEEIRVQDRIKKKKVKNIKIRKPVSLQGLFPSRCDWAIKFTLYYLWNLLLLVFGIVILALSIQMHIYLHSLWPSLMEDTAIDADLEDNAVVLFCATVIPLSSTYITEFIGLPYASLPIGNAHFYKPGPLTSFVDCYKAYWVDLNPKQKNFQNGRIKFLSVKEYSTCKQIIIRNLNVTGKDSCLTISVKSPFIKKKSIFSALLKNKTKTLLPVVIYLTGRTYIENRPFPVGDFIVSKSRAVFISINYRLGILGFSNFDLMKSPKNIGYIDFLMAMDFILKYLELFSGDKNRIMLLAEESGATTGLINMIMKKDRNLFSKIWLIDGSGFVPDRTARSLFYDLYSSQNILCTVYLTAEEIFDCLQNFSSSDLLVNSPIGWLKANNYFFYLPNIFEERQSIIERSDNLIDNPLEVVMKAGSSIADIPIVVMSKIDYIPYPECLQFLAKVGKLTKKELYTRTRMGLLNYQTGVSQIMLHSEINNAYKEYVKFVENRSIFSQNVNEYIVPLGFEDVFKAIISDIRSICPYNALAKYLQVNGHIVKGPIYRIIDGGNKYTDQSEESNSTCDLNYFLQDESSTCIAKSNGMPPEYRGSLVNGLLNFINNGHINNALQMQYPQNSTMKEFEDTFTFIGRLGFRTPGVREIGMLQACNIWKKGSDEYPMLKTSSKVN